MARRKVVLTGASGYIASLMLPALRENYDLTMIDVRDTDRNGNKLEGIHIADLINPNRDGYRELFRGSDAVIHLGFTRPENEEPESRFWAEFSNVQMAFNIYQVSWEENVRRVVVASSNHAADYYEPLILQKKMDMVYPGIEMRPLSDNYYGWAKEVYEHLGFVFAVGKANAEARRGGIQAAISAGGATLTEREQGRPLENVQIRIGGPRETDVERCPPGDMVVLRRGLGAYLSARDLSQLFIKSIETEDIRDENGVPFQVFYGISGNSHGFWSIANARKVIGYEPQDNSEVKFSEGVQEHLRIAKAAGSV